MKPFILILTIFLSSTLYAKEPCYKKVVEPNDDFFWQGSPDSGQKLKQHTLVMPVKLEGQTFMRAWFMDNDSKQFAAQLYHMVSGERVAVIVLGTPEFLKAKKIIAGYGTDDCGISVNVPFKV